MHTEPTIIDRDPKLPKSIDYKALKAEGIKLLQELCGEIWTDYNAHDPGVTILEQLCYALTELGHKARVEIQELIGDDDEGRFLSATLFEVDQILPTAPISIMDYRKLMLDQIPEIRNIWFLPQNKSVHGLAITGLYHVKLQLKHGSRADQQQVKDKIKRLFAANRNLCEDLETIHILQPKELMAYGKIQIQPGIVPEIMLAQILFLLQNEFSPPIHRMSWDQAVRAGIPVEKLLEGPLLKYGFLMDDELEHADFAQVNTISHAKLIKLIEQLDGVQSISDFELTWYGKKKDDPEEDEQEKNKDLIQLAENEYAVLDPQMFKEPLWEYALQVQVGGLKYKLDFNMVNEHFNALKTSQGRNYQAGIRFPRATYDKKYKKEQISRYVSIQHHFPRTYGIGSFGIPTNLIGQSIKERQARKAHAKQLKGYLILFEQFMANFLAELTNAYHMLDLEDDKRAFYFQSLYHLVPYASQVLGTEEEYKQKLKEAGDNLISHAKKQGKLLDHQLARFGEQFFADAFEELNQTNYALDKLTPTQKLLHAKKKFLLSYAFLSQHRSLGFDFLDADLHARTALEQKIEFLTGIEAKAKQKLAAIAKDKKINLKPRDRKVSGDSFIFSSDDPEILKEVLSRAMNQRNFRIAPSRQDRDKYAIYYRPQSGGAPKEILVAPTQGDCVSKLKKLIDFIIEKNKESEGFYLMEHILLRPVERPSFIFQLFVEGRKLLRSAKQYTDKESGILDFVSRMNELGVKAANYKIVKTAGDRPSYILQLLNAQQELVAVSEAFRTKKSAEMCRDETIELIKKHERKIDDFITAQEQFSTRESALKHPYSSQISLLLPAWPARFQEIKVRELLGWVVKQQIPAHLQTNLLWLEIDQMQEFESLYRRWRKEKKHLQPEQPLLDDLAYYLMLLISSFASPLTKADQKLLAEFRDKHG